MMMMMKGSISQIGLMNIIIIAVVLGSHYRLFPGFVFVSSSIIRGCKSNETHIGWIMNTESENSLISSTSSSNAMESSSSPSCQFFTHEETLSSFNAYLYHNIMPFDIPNAESLGFHPHQHSLPVEDGETILQRQRRLGSLVDKQTKVLPDGLSDGIANITVHMALDAKVQYPWTRNIPMDIYQEYVLNFVNVNEARSDWRPIFHSITNKIVTDNKLIDNRNTSIADVVKVINRDLWLLLGGGKNALYFKAGQTPLIYDPMSIMVYGYGSCTGLSIVLVNALRSVGVPARLVGTPAWWGHVDKGNHNWVEVYSHTDDDDDDANELSNWNFLEPAYGDYGTNHADNLERNPCQRWFCHKQRFGPTTGTKVYAARYDRTSTNTYYPMPWCPSNKDVPGEERTKYYQQVCGKCP